MKRRYSDAFGVNYRNGISTDFTLISLSRSSVWAVGHGRIRMSTHRDRADHGEARTHKELTNLPLT
jgi:hypothetical protein